jgi:hypothetical protein
MQIATLILMIILIIFIIININQSKTIEKLLNDRIDIIVKRLNNLEKKKND